MEAEGNKKIRDTAKIKFTKSIKKLQIRLNNSASDRFLEKALDEVKETWEALDVAQTNFMLDLEEGEKEREENAHAQLDDQREQIVVETEDILEERKGVANSGVTGEEGSGDNRTQKKKNESSSQLVSMKDAESGVSSKVRKLLSGIKVSKTAREEYLKRHHNRMVESWVEDTKCKVFQRVQMEKWSDFINLFQKSTSISDEVKASFEAMDFTGATDEQVKTFNCKGLDLKGKYGMFAIARHENSEVDVADVAYCVFSFDSQLINSENMEKDKKNGLNVEQNAKQSELLSVGDVDALTQKFIIYKALSAFAHSGAIARVQYEEDMNNEIEGSGNMEMLTIK